MYNRNILVEQTDPELWAAILAENARQEHHIELIASENYASPAVMAAQGSQLTNKYAEGYPGKRYYGGCEHVDVAEQLAIDRVKLIFGAEAANVQPHCGASANEAVFLAFLKPGDTIMGMSLAEGGHLTHGMPLNMSGKWFNVVSYGLDANEAIDYDVSDSAGLGTCRLVGIVVGTKCCTVVGTGRPLTTNCKRLYSAMTLPEYPPSSPVLPAPT